MHQILIVKYVHFILIVNLKTEKRQPAVVGKCAILCAIQYL